jgi:hypothetical protein
MTVAAAEASERGAERQGASLLVYSCETDDERLRIYIRCLVLCASRSAIDHGTHQPKGLIHRQITLSSPLCNRSTSALTDRISSSISPYLLPNLSSTEPDR